VPHVKKLIHRTAESANSRKPGSGIKGFPETQLPLRRVFTELPGRSQAV
jgi:hypothetical protein